MTKNFENNYTDKHVQKQPLNPELAEIIKKKTIEAKMPCAVAFKIAQETNLPTAEVGTALDLLEIKISKCQLGIFGYGKDNKFIKPMETVTETLQKAINDNLKGGKLGCREAWNIAEKLEISRMDVASACDTLRIKISSCQLGAF
jgi:hypothetical protein